MSNKNSNKKIIDVAIIGGGASGLSAAIAAAKLSKVNKDNKIIEIFEAENKIGKSILKTGNGRCNFSNYFIDENNGESYNNKEFFNKVEKNTSKIINEKKLFGSNLEMNSAWQMFENLGLACYCDDDGKMFPYTNKASSVVDVLRYEIDDLGIKINCNFQLKDVDRESESKNFYLKFNNGKIYEAKKVIFTTGSQIINNKKLKENSNEFKKVLGPLKTDTKFLKNLDGTKVHAKVSIYDNKNKALSSEIGEVLFRKYGISGICVFNLSRFLIGKKQNLEIDFAPEDKFEDLLKVVKVRFDKLKSLKNKKIDAQRLFAGMILPNVVCNICAFANVDSKNLKKEDLAKLCKAIKAFKLVVLGIGDEKQCQVKRGGIKTSSLNSKTLEAKFAHELYFAGELVDIDGPCGGYNLHWAWTSGILAGASSIIN